MTNLQPTFRIGGKAAGEEAGVACFVVGLHASRKTVQKTVMPSYLVSKTGQKTAQQDKTHTKEGLHLHY